MLITNIYNNNLLKYPLTIEQYNKLEKVWEFIKIFKRQYIFITDYRKNVIRKIRKYYNAEEFLEYETILNKLFWNLRWLLFPLWVNKKMTEKEYEQFIKNKYDNNKHIPYSLLLCNYNNYSDDKDLKKKIKNNSIFNTTYYRSFINKLIIVDKKKKVIITKPIEGSSHIFNKNYFNLLTMTILYNKNLYKEIMQDPYSIKNKYIQLSHYYYQYDYAFPNLTFCTYDFGTKEQKLDRIKKMYFENKPKAKYWFKLII